MKKKIQILYLRFSLKAVSIRTSDPLNCVDLNQSPILWCQSQQLQFEEHFCEKNVPKYRLIKTSFESIEAQVRLAGFNLISLQKLYRSTLCHE